MKGLRDVLILTLSLFITSISYSQSGNYKYWSTTPISWDDFYEVAPNNDSSLSNFSYRIGIRYEKKIITDTLLVHTEVYAYMSKKNSWVKNEAKTKQFLAYHQILLNMLELYRRKIQNVYYTLDNPYTADSLFEDYSKAYET